MIICNKYYYYTTTTTPSSFLLLIFLIVIIDFNAPSCIHLYSTSLWKGKIGGQVVAQGEWSTARPRKDCTTSLVQCLLGERLRKSEPAHVSSG